MPRKAPRKQDCHLASERKNNPASVINAFRYMKKIAGPGQIALNCLAKGRLGLCEGNN